VSAPRGDESGFTLVECLLAVAILGIAFAVLLGGMSTSIVTSDMHRKQAAAGALLIQAVESIKDENRNPFRNADCASTATYNPYTGVRLPPGWSPRPGYTTIKVESVKYWDGSSFGDNCVTGFGLQLVNVAVSSPEARSVERVGVVKRNVL
jgi:prepilin-type N-terminal cleavage/methylation domain-containing protein